MENRHNPAHPIPGMPFNENYRGLTKREMFAMAAMSGILSNPNETLENKNLLQGGLIDSTIKTVCGQAVRYADELLKQLEM